ncbi:MAG: hypothetical protein ACXAC5_04005 [Promethearchaeota archaeon]
MKLNLPYIVQDDIPYACCQLLTAINARVFLTGEPPIIEYPSQEFETLVDLTLCRHGAALRVDKAYKILKIHTQRGPRYADIEWIKRCIYHEGRPVELSVRSPEYGIHSVLAIGVEDNAVQLVNWKRNQRVSLVPWCKEYIPGYHWGKPRALWLME